MSGYTDTTLLNCNRSASVEARSGNDTNPAIFTNTLEQTVPLDVGDKISLERAFISEIGAGNSQTIEFKGSIRGKHKVPKYTKFTGEMYYELKSTTFDPNYRLGGFRAFRSEQIENEEIDLRDNLAPLTFGYYITANEYPNYIQQPRRFIQTNDTRNQIPINPSHFTYADGESEGFAHFTINPDCFVETDWIKRAGKNAEIIYKQQCDNSRYTMFIKDDVSYSADLNGSWTQFPKKFLNGVLSECNYNRLIDRVDIEIKKGFNTPTAVAKQISEQLNTTTAENTFKILDLDGFSRTITKTIENKTYRPINCQNIYNCSQLTFAEYKKLVLPLSANPSQDCIDYIATFAYIAVKRPEIFETGRIMGNTIIPTMPEILDVNGNVRFPAFTGGFEGFQISETVDTIAGQTKNTFQDITTNIPYNETNLKLIRDFLDTQAYYTELWTSLKNSKLYNDVRIGYQVYNSTNSRFFHINKYTSTVSATHPYNETLGSDGFHKDASATQNVVKNSLPIFFKYDNATRDKYIEPENYSTLFRDGLMYGFAYPVRQTNYGAGGVGSSHVYFIKLNTELTGGIPIELYTDSIIRSAQTFPAIKEGRRCGFDFHSTAYSTAIITPFSGYSNCDMGTQVKIAGNTETFQDTSNILLNLSTINDAVGTDVTPYQTQTYIGANNPELAFNNVSNRFEFKRLHTANNTGNRDMAGADQDNLNNNSLIPPLQEFKAPPVNVDAASTVYKISPRPPQFGFSPTFKPYTRYDQSYQTGVYPKTPDQILGVAPATADPSGNEQYVEKINENIEPFAIFDSHGGIYIDNFGISENNWNDNLWDILGFDYDSVQAPPSSSNVLTQRVNNTNTNALYRPTTNGEIIATDGKAYTANRYGSNMYYTSLPYPQNIIKWSAGQIGGGNTNNTFNTTATGSGLVYYPEITIKTESTTITASNLQKSVLKPYYSVRSSLLEGTSAIGGNPTVANLPIISIIDKYSAQGDYFFGNTSDLSFTVTRKTTVADITTSIHDPDGEFSNVNGTSAVIYKIEKFRPPPVNILEEILKGNKK